MNKRSRYSKITDVEEQYLTPTDIKQYVFCPRVTFFNRVMNLKPVMGSQQEAGQKTHDRLSHLEKKRLSVLKAGLELQVETKMFDIPVVSHNLGVRGRLDMLLVTSQNEYIPVEFKEMRSNKGQVRLDHKYQLTLLGLMVENAYDTIVRRGIVHYTLEELTIEKGITMSMKTRTKSYVERINRMIEDGSLPSPRAQCRFDRVGCGYANQCADF